jgi:hypothetical protein
MCFVQSNNNDLYPRLCTDYGVERHYYTFVYIYSWSEDGMGPLSTEIMLTDDIFDPSCSSPI